MKYSELGISCNNSQQCTDLYGCPSNIAPNFCIKRHDTKPPLKISIEDCGGTVDFTDETLVLEASIWANAKLKKSIDEEDDYVSFADNIGFFQVMQNDIIVMDRVRMPEHMLVTGFDENNKLIRIQRGYNGTSAQSWKKGDSLRIFRVIDAPATIESVYEDVLQADGIVNTNQLVGTFFVYEWDANSTCLPGCYWLEFKLLKISDEAPYMKSNSISVIPSFTPSTLNPSDFGCGLESGVEWTRRFPSASEGFLIRIIDTPTKDL